MKLLHANDAPGRHAPSWYAARGLALPDGTVRSLTPDTPASDLSADVVIVGGGFTGLVAAVALAERGIRVSLFDAHRIGWGASGRNGGQLGSGFNQGQDELAARLGNTHARALWAIAEDAKRTVQARAAEAGCDIGYRPGVVWAMHRARKIAPVHAYAEYLKRQYDYPHLEPLDHTALQQHVRSPQYCGGVIDHGAGHLDPLALARALALLATRHGARLFEQAEVVALTQPDTLADRWRVQLASGQSLRAARVIVACNGYVDTLLPAQNRVVMPINNFIVATEPLGDQAAALLPGGAAVADSRFVVNYFRRTDEGRLLFGGGETYGYRFPSDIDTLVRRALSRVFPALKAIRFDYCWGGTLAITRNRLPWVRRLHPGLYAAAGYSGHGVALAVQTGQAIGTAIADDDAVHHDANGKLSGNVSGSVSALSQFATLSAIPAKAFPSFGGDLGRGALLALAMTAYSWRDRF